MPDAAGHLLASEARLDQDLGEPPDIPAEGVERALEVIRSGRIHRYGERGALGSEVSRLEEAFAKLIGRRFAVAVNSCGSALFLSLVAGGVRPGDKVLMNAFTLAPVPGAIAHAGAEHVLVEVTEDYVVDLDDLDRKAAASGARHLLLSHMRGHISDLEAVRSICDRRGIRLVEDCAHTLGASWAGTPTGAFGSAGCFSLQSYKHANGGEGGVLVTDDEDLAARAILYSGSYMLYLQNGARPSQEAFERWKYVTPNLSLRMSELVAALVLPQIALLPGRALIWNERHDRLADRLARAPGIRLPHRPAAEEYVQSSIQFSVGGLTGAEFERFLALCAGRGVVLKWFGSREPKGFTSVSSHWRYIGREQPLPRTASVMERLCDMRIPLTLRIECCDLIAEIVADALVAARGASPA